MQPSPKVNRYKQKHSQAALERRLLGQQDPRGPVGIFARGKNIYGGGSPVAHHGGGQQFGRPNQKAVQRRLQRRR